MRLGLNAVGAVMGGAARHLPPFVAAVQAVRPDWDIVVWVSAGAEQELACAAADVSIRTSPATGALGRLRWENTELVADVREERIDALLNLTNSGPLRSPVPSVLYQRNSYWFDPDWLLRCSPRIRAEAVARRQLTFLQARAASVVVVPSRAMADFLRRWRGWPSARAIAVVPHAVDLERFRFRARDWPPGPAPLTLLAVGHQAPHKDQILLIDALGVLRSHGRDARLVLTIDAGAGGYVDDLVARCDRLGLTGHVVFAGTVAEVETLYRDADIALSASITESFGFPILEAMSAGVPVVASAIPASTEILGSAGSVFAVGRPDDAARRVEELLDEEPSVVLSRLRDASERAARFDWPSNARCIVEVIESIIR